MAHRFSATEGSQPVTGRKGRGRAAFLTNNEFPGSQNLMKKLNVLAASITLALGASLPLGTALAQDQNDQDGMGAILEEVIVTARKREESLQEIPVAISVFGQDDIAAAESNGGSREPTARRCSTSRNG